MKNLQITKKFGKGQVIPLVVLMMFAIIGMVALIIDGASIMSARRAAQAAADAGALAGAQRVCMGKTDAIQVAEYYATENNDATSAVATVDGKEVTVNTTIDYSSFFAKIFGEQSLQATAEAVAGCYYPSVATSVLPIAFYYEAPPVNASDADCSDGSCTLVAWPFEELMDSLRDTEVVDVGTGTVNLPLDDIYIISDKTKICERIAGQYYCTEMKGDEDGGNRGFIDLNDVVKDIIRDGLDVNLYLPTWVNAEPGAVVSAYKPDNFITDYPPIVGYEDLDARLYFLPVFDKYCTDCSCEPQEEHMEYCDQTNTDSYHLLGFGSFVVTCVQMNSKCVYGDCVPSGDWHIGGESVEVKKDICPGLLATVVSDPDTVIESAIEGYFVEEFPADQTQFWGTQGADVGVYLISLSK
jgi:hypothetical protein